jgi:hypothetical protein
MKQPKESAGTPPKFSDGNIPISELVRLLGASRPVMTLYYTHPVGGLDSKP